VAVQTKTRKTAGYFTLSMAAIPLENLADTVNCPGMAMFQRSTLDKRELRWIQLSMPFSEALQQRRSCINIHPFY
jgi:hypothetical protein